MSRKFIGRLAVVIAAVSLAGCGSDYSVAKVSGRVTLDGAPLSGASITFQPVAESGVAGKLGMGSYGRTDQDGQYTLKLIDNDKAGAAVGKHRVQVSLVEESDGDEVAPDRIPARYRGGDSVLEFTVPQGGTEEANFDLTSQPK